MAGMYTGAETSGSTPTNAIPPVPAGSAATAPMPGTGGKTPAQDYAQRMWEQLAAIEKNRQQTIDSLRESGAGLLGGDTPETIWDKSHNFAADNYAKAVQLLQADEAKGLTPEQRAAAAQITLQSGQADLDEKTRLAHERRPDGPHPGQTNQEAIASNIAQQGMDSARAAQILAAQGQILLGKHYTSQDELAKDIFAYGRLKDELDARVAAHDKDVKAKLDEATLASARRGQDITQRGQDVGAFSSLVGTYAHDLAPVEAYADMGEVLKQFADPTYKPNYKNSAAAPYNPAALVGAAYKQYAPAPIGDSAAAGKTIAAQVANSPNPAATATVTAPPLGPDGKLFIPPKFETDVRPA